MAVPTYRVDLIVERTITFYVAADDDEDIEAFLEGNPDWQPGDVPGLIDLVSEEIETGHLISEEESISAGYALIDGELVEIE